jgi:hypothetical protein
MEEKIIEIVISAAKKVGLSDFAKFKREVEKELKQLNLEGFSVDFVEEANACVVTFKEFGQEQKQIGFEIPTA